MRVVGCSLVANAISLDFPIVEAIRSILPLCDEVIVNVGPSDDDTRALVESIGDPRLRIIDGTWDRTLGSAVLAVETQRCLAAAHGDWAVYIQADEIADPAGLGALRAAMLDSTPDTEGLLVDFVHFYGSTDWVARSRSWYRHEVRAVRLGRDIRSVGDAQGFRVGPENRRVNARRTGARWLHYGWARPLVALRAKRETDNALFYRGDARRAAVAAQLPWDVGLTRFTGQHPELMQAWIAERRSRMSPGFAPRRWDLRRLSLLATYGIERLTGWRPFERRNYVVR
ncbi:MAG TPA: glycosyltransferase [Gemmatimonadales bacterium]|nr:glycosyltransferase [Gemmatimonadales bacterium]